MSDTIVYLPGVAGDAGVSPALQQLAEDGKRIVIPDLPGFNGETGFTPPVDYLDWLGAFGWSTFGNLVGGLVLVTGIRLLRIPHRVAESRAQGQTG